MSWIASLRRPFRRRELSRLPAVDIGYGDVRVEWMVSVMLSELDDLDALAPDEAATPLHVRQRASLLADFRTLRSLID